MHGFSNDVQWSLRPDGGYTRACGYLEQLLYWAAVQDGGHDLFFRAVVDVRQDVPVQSIFNRENVTRAWIHLKRLYPLLGARTEEQNGHVRFVVFEKDLHSLRSDELMFEQTASDEQASELLSKLSNAKSTLTPWQLSRIIVLTGPDDPQRVHLIVQVAHCVSDGTAQATIQTTLLDLLVKSRPFTHKLQDRLALSISMDALKPIYPRNSPRQRWRKAIATIMIQRRPIYGGHTLPQKVTTATPYSTVTSDWVLEKQNSELSSRILAGCKRMGITFGKILPVIGQVAATRLLFRHYIQGKISEEEWEFRKREPMHTSGPVNVRHIMDKNWYKAGGKSHVCTCIDYFTLTLPFMPLGELSNVRPSSDMPIPPFSSFLSVKRFLLRCEMAQKQIDRFIKHPLFFEKGEIGFHSRIRLTRDGAIKWREDQTKPEELRNKGIKVSPMELSRTGPVYTHQGSSIGVIDALHPKEYPLGVRAGEEPIIRVEKHESYMHCRPAYFYLGSQFIGGHLYLATFWDANVYEGGVVKEFVKEVWEALEWYLARSGNPKESSATKL